MACALTQGYTRKVCKDPSGIKSVLIGEWANVDWSDATKYALTANVVTTLTMSVDKQMWRFAQAPGVANFKCTGKGNATSGGYGYDITGTMQTPDMGTLTIEQNALLTKNNLFVIAELQNGDYYLYGQEYGLDAIDDNDTGTAMDDFKGDIITFSGMATIKPKKVNAALIAVLLEPAAGPNP